MPKRDGTPTRGELREQRRKQRNAQNSGLDYAQTRLRAGNNQHAATAIERSPGTQRNRLLDGVRIAATEQDSARWMQHGDATANSNPETDRIATIPDDANSLNGANVSNSGVGRLSDRHPPPHRTKAARDSADLSQTPTVSSQVSYLAPPISPSSPPLSEVIEAAGVGLKVKPPQVDDAGDVRWVMENLHTEGAEGNAPSRSALAMLMFAKSDKNAMLVFVRDVFGKVFINRNAEEQERMERRRLGEIGEMIGRCLELRLRTEAELREPVMPEGVVTGV